MPAVQRSEFFLALNQLATERGLDVSIIIDAVKNAILAAYRKDHPEAESEEYTVTLNQNTGEARVLKGEEDVTPPGFGRIAAQTAKQVILQKVREEEKAAVLADFKARIGTVMNGMILRFIGPNIIVILGKTEALFPVSEQIQNEKYHPNQQLAFYILDIREGPKGQELIVSRSNKGLLEGLFRKEVPEIMTGGVIFKAIAREAGVRSKIAVAATASGIDPVGSCVGQKGVRVQAVIQEFGGLEKIDVIQWQEDPTVFIAHALAPAKNLEVSVDENTKSAIVMADPDELASAIGKDGQNARLASELTGYEIKIMPKEGTSPKAEAAVKEEASIEAEVKETVATEPATTEEVKPSDEAMVTEPAVTEDAHEEEAPTTEPTVTEDQAA